MSTRARPGSPADDMATEAMLVECFVNALHSGTTCWGGVEVTTEWDHRSGLADILARTGKRGLIAFEAKLADWRRAFHQAYRSTMYANRVYVLMPRTTVHRALQFEGDFRERGIGLCSYHGGRIYVHIRAVEQHDLLSWVRREAHAHFDEEADECRNASQSGSRLLSTKANRVHS